MSHTYEHHTSRHNDIIFIEPRQNMPAAERPRALVVVVWFFRKNCGGTATTRELNCCRRMLQKFLTVKEVAFFLKKDRRTIYRLFQYDPPLPSIKIGGSRVVLESDLNEFINKGRSGEQAA